MEVLWKRAQAMAVRDACSQLDGEALAYTTVMTTLDRLYKKGLSNPLHTVGAAGSDPATPTNKKAS